MDLTHQVAAFWRSDVNDPSLFLFTYIPLQQNMSESMMEHYAAVKV